MTSTRSETMKNTATARPLPFWAQKKFWLSASLLALGMAYAASQAHAAIEVARVDDDELSCEQIAAEVKKMDAIAASGSADAKAAAQRKARLEALAKATKCKL
jgi:hypothetical protein